MNRYTIVKLVGAGGEAKALLVKKNGTENLYVMKQRNFLNLEQANEGLNEAISLAKIANLHIVRFEEVFIYYNEDIYSLCIVMEYCDGGDLMDFLFNVILDNNKDNNSSSGDDNTDNDISLHQKFMATLHTYTPTSSSSSNCSSSSSFLNIPITSPTIHPMSPGANTNSPLRYSNSGSSCTGSNSDLSSLSSSLDNNNTTTTTSIIQSPSLEKIDELIASTSQNSNNSNNTTYSGPINNSNSNFKPKFSFYLTSLNDEGSSSNNNTTNNSTNTIQSCQNLNSLKPDSPKASATLSKKERKELKREDSGTGGKSKWWKSHRKSRSRDSIEEKSPSSNNTLKVQSPQHQQQQQQQSSPSPRTSSTPKSGTEPTQTRLQLPKKVLYKWLYQICLGVHSIHAAHFIHRDLKSENIFLHNFEVKIGDFGLATKYDTTIKGIAGTYFYSAPEVLQNKSYSRPADIFSLGCIFYEMITLRLLPLTKRCIGDEMIQGTFNRQLFLQEFPIEYYQLAELILEMLNPNPNMRPSIDLIIHHKIFERAKRGSMINGQHNSSQKDLMKGGSYGTPEIMPTLSNYGGFRKQLDRNEAPIAAKILTDAMVFDPRFDFLCGARSRSPQKVEKSKELGQLIRKNFFEMGMKVMFTERFMLWGYYNSDNDLSGVASWLLPDKKKSIPVVPLILKLLSILPKIGFNVIKKMGMLSKSIDRALKKSGNNENTYMLAYIGINKEYQSKGIGQYLLQPVLEWADCNGRKCKAVAFNQRSLPFFMKMGFEVALEEKQDLPRGLDPIYILVRNPKPR
ncbi:putative protein serine/threonine kinase [Tieghemostelium lacteum]|uniref:non-specific serine/threonine protein kinase n=1 Tax=Tieghemostelium lacteum TaxID=361077 RepID=A0A152A907_TIELA|nr:putative protein serine/threonine kinase [Tieghemostelium lacteum]|eukprot:KYR02706.1 putative protein serine/threonine kinase [Tieghemostelium lacteum]